MTSELLWAALPYVQMYVGGVVTGLVISMLIVIHGVRRDLGDVLSSIKAARTDLDSVKEQLK